MSVEKAIRGVLQDQIAPKTKELQEDTLPGKGKDTWMKDGVEMCPEECCGQPVTECKCGTDCKICNCAERKAMMEEELDEKAGKYSRRGDKELYQWGDINQAMMDSGLNVRQIMKVMTALSHAKIGHNESTELEEKKLTPAELKKREEVAKAIERENPKMPMDQKMAIATATAKKVAEATVNTADIEKHKNISQSDKDKIAKIADMMSKEKKPKTEAYDEPQGQAKRMMSPLQKARMDKEKADRDRDGKLKPGVVKVKKEEVEIEEAMNASSIEKAMRKALKDRGNYKNGKVNWNFIDADTYMEIKPGRAQAKQFYRMFDQIADKLTKEMNLKEEISEAKKVSSMQIHKVLAKTKNSREGIAALKKAFRVNDTEAKKMLNQVMNEETIDEISRSMTPMSKRFGKAVDPKKFDVYKKHVKQHKVDEPTVRFIDDNPNHNQSKRAMQDKHVAQAVKLYKDAHKESVDEVLDTPDRAMNYKHRAKYSRDRARNSQAAHMLRGTDPSKDKDTERKRERGLKTLNRNIAGKIRKSMMKNEKFANAAQQAAVMAKLKASGKYKKEEVQEAKKPDETVNIRQSLKKAIDMRGQKEVVFKDGSKAKISVQDAEKAMKMLDTTRMAKAKQDLTVRMMKSHQDFKDTLAGKKPKVDPFALRVRKEDNNPKVVRHLELAKKARAEGDYDKANYHTHLARQMQNENTFISKFKGELKEKKRVSETKGAPKGYHFTRSGQLKKGDAGQDGPGGKMLRSDPLDKQRKKIPPLPENDK